MIMSMSSNRSYLIEAIHKWCLDNHLTPYIVIDASFSGVKLPKPFLMGKRMIVNISPKAVKSLQIDREKMDFYANFSQKVEKIHAPIDAIMAIYAYENGEGITFDEIDDEDGDGEVDMSVCDSDNDDVMINKKIPKLTLIK